MEQKQTAVEWLVETINNKIDYIPIKYWDSIRDIVQQAKEMEKEQIIEAFWNGDNTDCLQEQNSKEFAEKYYNETYGSK